MGNVACVLRPPCDGSSSAPAPQPSAPTDPKNNRDGGKLDVDGIGGWNTLIDWQHQLGTTEDGWISGQDESNAQFFSNIFNVTYEETGSQLVEAIQAKVGAVVDGFWGKETSTKIQEWLIAHGYSVGEDGADGYFGQNSVIGLQHSLNDGAWR